MPIFPLGDCFSGDCRSPLPGERASAEAVREICNFGYAGGRCKRFPGGPDGVRFGVTARTAATVRISFAIEQSHLPFAHGLLEFSIADDTFALPHPDEILARQARAYMESYLRRSPDTRA